MTSRKPIIGLTSSYEKTETTDYIFVNHSYLNAVRQFGGIPLVLPSEADEEELQMLVAQCDGLLLTGGDDIDPELYGEEKLNDTVELTPVRDRAEKVVCDMAVERGIPILGICRGVQMLNVYFGGSLYQDIPAQIPSEILHRMEKPFHRTGHRCIVEKETPLHALAGVEVIGVNSHHHQAIKRLADGFVVMGRAEDGVIEAIYRPGKPFIWGVQWHPERIWDIEESSAKLFERFVDVCRDGN